MINKDYREQLLYNESITHHKTFSFRSSWDIEISGSQTRTLTEDSGLDLINCATKWAEVGGKIMYISQEVFRYFARRPFIWSAEGNFLNISKRLTFWKGQTI